MKPVLLHWGRLPIKKNPSVSILIPTYRRPHLLPEIMQSCVLAAERYQGGVEVVVCNDDALTEYSCNHELFRIINRSIRISTVGLKRCYLWSQCRGEVVVYCDDDDVRGSNFINDMVGRMVWSSEGFGVYKTDRCISDTAAGGFAQASIDALWNYAISDSLLRFIGGVPVHNIALRRISAWMEGWKLTCERLPVPNVVFRRNEPDTYHISIECGTDKNMEIEPDLSDRRHIELVPQWSRDWDAVIESVDLSVVESSGSFRPEKKE